MENSQANSDSSDTPVICVFGVGYDKYWEQFDGLLEKLMDKHNIILGKISRNRAKVFDFGMVDNPMKAYEVLRRIESAGPDLVFCTMLTYATSGTFGIIIKSLSVPVVLIALQPLKAMDYANASTFMLLSSAVLCC
mgnify:FL=1